jgi:hypothetical protein
VVTAGAHHLREALRGFCLGAFAALDPEVQRGDIPFVVEERDGLYQYRPLVRDHVEARVAALFQLEDARIALAELRREPAAAIFSRGSADGQAADRTLFRAIVVPLLVSTAERCGGFDWDDGAFDRVYAELEQSLFGAARAYSAAVPLVGVSISSGLELARGIRVKATGPAELCRGRADAERLLPPGFGAEPERVSALELERVLPAGESALPDGPGELADAVTALRLATGAAIAAGPVVLERLDRHPLEPRPMLGIAATEPDGEPTRLDPWRGRLAGDLLERLAASEQDGELGEAIERWELALFESEAVRSERLREALAALLGGADGVWAAGMRAALLVGEPTAGRARLVEGLRGLARGGGADAETADAVRRVLVETVLHDDRRRLLETLDDALLGLRPRPAGYFSLRASAA